MSPFPAQGKAQRILAAVRSGAETAREVEAIVADELNLSLHQIAGHLSNLNKSGRIRTIGTRKYLAAGRNGSERFVTVSRYRAEDQP